MTDAPGRFWIIRSPNSQGAVVGKFDTEGETTIPEEVADYGGFIIQKVADRSALVDKEVDHSGLSDEERTLLEKVYLVR